jgi:hypothetical protein
MAAPEEDPETEAFSLLDFYKNNGLSWGTADLIVAGRSNAAARFGELAAILRIFNAKGRPLVSEIVAVSPASEGAPDLGEIKVAFAASCREIHGWELTLDQLDTAFRIVRCVRSECLDVDALVDLVEQAKPHTAFIVRHAALYRAGGIQPAPREVRAPEDVWVPHLHTLADRIVAASRTTECYVVLDAGEFFPVRPENRALLCSVDGAVCSADDPGRAALDMATRAGAWHDRVLAGDLSGALDEIDALDGLSAERKTLMGLRMYNLAGLAHHTKTTLEAVPTLTADLPPDVLLQTAIVAEEADADAMASSLLARALPGLRVPEQLEAALSLADRLHQSALVVTCEAALASAFPASGVLRARRVTALARDHRFDEASALLRQNATAEELETSAFFDLLSYHLTSEAATDTVALLTAVAERFPRRRLEAARIAAKHLEAKDRRQDAVALLLPDGTPFDRATAWTALDMVERGRLVFDPLIDDEVIAAVMERTVEGLAQRPKDGATRLRLARMLSPQVLGSRGMLTLAVVVLSLATRNVTIRSRPPVDQRPGSCAPERLTEIIRRGFDWLGQERVILLGRKTFPTKLLDVPADEALAGFENMIEYIGGRLADDGDLRTLECCLAMGMAIAPLASEPNEDLVIVRLAATKLAVAGRVQRARDLAEQALTVAGADPARARLAWFAFADIYARLNNLNEALIGIACALAADSAATWDQIWYENLLIFRLFRDLGLIERAKPLLETARDALRHLGVEDRYAYRLETVELQIGFLEYDRADTPDAAQLLALIEGTVRNLECVLDRQDEPLPATMLLASLLGRAEKHQVTAPPAATAWLGRAFEQIGPRSRALIEAAGALRPTIEQVMVLAGQMESARYAEDVGFDVRALVIAARRLLETPAADDPRVATYATEVLADQAITLPNAHIHGGAAPRATSSADGPTLAAQTIAREGLAVVMLGLAGGRLRRVIAADGVLQPTAMEPGDVFSANRLAAWGRTYPYGYRDAQDVNVFYTSTEGLGVSSLPDRAVAVAGTDLQGLPVNLLRIGDQLAGRTRRLATAPSLTWLQAAHRNAFAGDGRITAWIPDAVPEKGLPTLAVIAQRLRDSFARHNVTLTNGPQPPEGLAGSDLVIVAAHGGVAEDKRYFRVVQDDVNLAIASSALSGRLANIGAVVLFVCSGGRIDKHPGASTTVGLAKQLLDRGCRAVIAPPWPLETSVPPYWLPAFLQAWNIGMPVIDACFEANVAVRSQLADDPAKYLAMTVYGDPLAAKSQLQNGPSSGISLSSGPRL